MTLTLRYAARSDRGLIRDGNQDSVYAGPRLLAVADGMGGMAAGDVASNIVISAISPLDDDVPPDNLIDAWRSAVGVANQQLRETVEANPRLDGMGSTLTGMLFSGSKLGLVHIGDSRAYMLRDGEFTQITKDDTYVQILVDEGRITLEDAATHPQRSLITKAMDGRDVEPEYSVRQVLPGDRYLICSDGLSSVVRAETMAETLREYVDPKQCVDRLLALALRAGGPDNITIIVADASDDDIVEQAPVVGGAASADRAVNASNQFESTPAARASQLNAPPRPPAPAVEITDEARPPRRHPVRATLVLVVLFGLFAGGIWFTWRYTQSHYYIGATENGQVAIFRGVPGQLAGFNLSEVEEISPMRLDNLTAVAQDQVRKGIQAKDEADAKARLSELIRNDPSNVNLLPVCPTITPSPSPTPSVTPTATPDPFASPTTSADPVEPSVSAQPNEPVVASPVPCRSN
ncbi:PP2C family protein-serine/threonine phosphatase [Allorhizocola rhizosphaerae]|uniref:PP2C family protein-serine/threonine phosphatase n=1 Tax=Allorhizocola rhizosphaerae TaxID=1872709 RepID=UPI000E3BE027|nr:PP2C family serine/threonine-protein phosphatase [Allorhizocola rhizosphaerae]